MTLPTTDSLPASRHFELERVAEGVYAAIATPGAGALGNAAIVDLGGRTLVFDTFMTPQAAQEVRGGRSADGPAGGLRNQQPLSR